MKSSRCSCCCGNLQINGQIVQIQMNIKASPNKEKVSNKKAYYLIQSNSVEILNKKLKSKQVKCCKSFNSLKCPICSTIFKLLTNDKKNYLEITKNNYVQGQINGQIEETDKDIKLNHIEDDCDFELMFSNKYYPLIGSYNSNSDYRFVGSLGNESFSDFQQTSFLA